MADDASDEPKLYICKRCGNDIAEDMDDPGNQLESWLEEHDTYCSWCVYQEQKSAEE
jgi:hypothetical protein